MSENLKYQIYLNLVSVTATTNSIDSFTGNTTGGTPTQFKIVGSDLEIRDFYDKDFYVNVPIFRNFKVEEYIDIKKDENVFIMERQEFNPYYIEFGFFDSIIRNKINHGSELNQQQVDYIKSVRLDLPATWVEENVKTWFETNGKSELPWFKGTVNEVTIDDITTVGQQNDNIISKASKFPIEINK